VFKSCSWFGFEKKQSTGTGRLVPGLLVGLLVSGLFLAFSRYVIASVVLGIAVVFYAGSIVSGRFAEFLERVFAWAGRFAGIFLGWVILTPVFFVVFPLKRLSNLISGADPLGLRGKNIASYWKPVCPMARKDRFARAMFAVEVVPSKKRVLLPAIFIVICSLLLAEVALRICGFGNPVLYVSDPSACYYPAPNSQTARYGGTRVYINSFGMRAPEFSTAKKPGVFRILLIGDSVLYGGSYIDQDRIYARLLERKLNNRAGSDWKYEVLNIGVNAWGPLHKIGYIEKYGTFDADMAIVCMPIGDVFRGKHGLPSLPYMSLGNPPRLALEEVLVHLLWRYRHKQVSYPELSESEGFAAYLELAEKMSETGAEVWFEVLPQKRCGMSGDTVTSKGELAARFKQELEKNGFRVNYPRGLFAGTGDGEEIYHDGVHLGVAGHEHYAGYLCAVILSQLEPME